MSRDWGQKVPDKPFHYIDVGGIDNLKGQISQELELLQPEDAPSRARKRTARGTVIYSTVRPYLKNIAVVDREFAFEAIASRSEERRVVKECVSTCRSRWSPYH